jgi:hypothetical protein
MTFKHMLQVFGLAVLLSWGGLRLGVPLSVTCGVGFALGIFYCPLVKLLKGDCEG